MESLRLQLEAAEAQQAAAAQETATVEAEISALRSQLGQVQVRAAAGPVCALGRWVVKK